MFGLEVDPRDVVWVVCEGDSAFGAMDARQLGHGYKPGGLFRSRACHAKRQGPRDDLAHALI